MIVHHKIKFAIYLQADARNVQGLLMDAILILRNALWKENASHYAHNLPIAQN
jgi:hypothetical protein